MNYVLILVGSILVNNFVMNKFMGICPFLGVSKKVETAFGMGMAVTFVMGVASLVTYFVRLLLVHFGIEYMQTIAFILVIAVLVQVVELVLRKISFALYQALGVYLPLITTNCAVLGVTILNVVKDTIFWNPWSTAWVARWVSRWRLCCSRGSASEWRFRICPSG